MNGTQARSLSLVLLLAFPGLLLAQSMPPTLRVSAQGSVQAAPDTALVQFAISGKDPNLKAAYTQAQQQADELRMQLRQLGFTPEQVKWSQYSVSQNPDYPSNQRLIYHVTADVQLLLTDFSRIAPLMNAVSGSGSNALRSVSFELRHNNAARKQAIAAAYADARAQAEALAAAAGLKLGKIVSAEVGAYVPAPMARPMAMASLEAAPTEQFTPQSLTVTANVTAVYQIEQP